MNRKKLLLKIVFIFILLLLIIFAEGDGEENLELGWYDVADWEISVCSEWGGISNTGDPTSGGSAGSMMQEYTSTTISASLQAEVLESDEGEFNLPEGTKVYAISWYIQPVSGSINYDVKAYYDGSLTEVLDDTSANPDSGYEGYFVKETELNMTHVILSVPSQDIELDVPVVG